MRIQAVLASKFELSQVVQEVETSPPLLERLIALLGWNDSVSNKFPRWLHVLIPEADSFGAKRDEAKSKLDKPPPTGVVAAAGGSSATVEQRLESLEAKMDQLLEQLVDERSTKRGGFSFFGR